MSVDGHRVACLMMKGVMSSCMTLIWGALNHASCAPQINVVQLLCVCVCVRACARVCVCVSTLACVCMYVYLLVVAQQPKFL